MPLQQVFHLRTSGWEQDPDEERVKVSTIDRTPTTSYNQYVVYFRVEEAETNRTVNVLKAGLETTLSQARYLCGTIEKDGGGHSFVKRKETAVKFVVQRLDLPGDNYPSLDDIEAAYFSARCLGDLDTWS
ncbi:hypothetical protein PFICI_12512 [Pestalotiopsis fici W106-1]|uniref:Uncharacterized protein n=1 Tax=Pestalotiopsis fici (strain W106-1 / CGMCC3.15140) TaxID=1229662 RepID=W3WNY3_PESFW|nr:uncharacterized protein PFICI_12512 [Pestalotiopsis fici W106-1]ETS75568.1 hypothetical protein PFICI_12512 [Pestalotiopsis fici W106-1]